MNRPTNRLELAKRAHEAAVAKGFWPIDGDGSCTHTSEHYLMLVITELSEAVEAHRKGRVTTRRTIDEYIKDSRGEFSPELFKSRIKDSVADELADAYIRCMDLSWWYAEHMDDSADSMERWIEEAKEEVSKFHAEECQGLADTMYWLIYCANYCMMQANISALIIALGIEKICDLMNIDLVWHVHEKMRYNETRPAKHGKEY